MTPAGQPETPLILALDLGTSSVRSLLFDAGAQAGRLP